MLKKRKHESSPEKIEIKGFTRTGQMWRIVGSSLDTKTTAANYYSSLGRSALRFFFRTTNDRSLKSVAIDFYRNEPTHGIKISLGSSSLLFAAPINLNRYRIHTSYWQLNMLCRSVANILERGEAPVSYEPGLDAQICWLTVIVCLYKKIGENYAKNLPENPKK